MIKMKRMCITLLTCFVASSGMLLFLGTVSVIPAYSQNYATINYFNDGLRKARSGWTLFTTEEKEVDRRIQAALQSIGRRSIPVTPENLNWMIESIGANRNFYTAGFIAGRMDVYARTTDTLDQTGSLLCSIGTQFNISAGIAYCP